jgi:hypothetical protein
MAIKIKGVPPSYVPPWLIRKTPNGPLTRPPVPMLIKRGPAGSTTKV